MHMTPFHRFIRFRRYAQNAREGANENYALHDFLHTGVQSRWREARSANTDFQINCPPWAFPPLPLQFTGHRHAPLAALIRQFISERRTVCEKAVVRCGKGAREPTRALNWDGREYVATLTFERVE